MGTQRPGCYYCFKTLNPEDQQDGLRTFVQCTSCKTLYHKICWEKNSGCLSCNNAQSELIQIASPPIFHSAIRKNTVPIKVSRLVYIFGKSIIIVPYFVYKHFQLLVLVGLVGLLLVISSLFWIKPDFNKNAVEIVSNPTVTPVPGDIPTSSGGIQSTPTPSPVEISTPTPVRINEKRFAKSETRIIRHCPSVNLRTSPIGDSRLISDVPCETEVELLGEAPSLANPLYKWYHIRLRGGNTEGWVYAGDDDTWLQVPSRSRIGIVKTEETRLNIRRGAGSQYKVIGKAEKGEKLIILGKEKDWYQVQLNDGTKGYAHKDFIVIQE